ncbi:hypothetical protein V8E36_003110 [Tilletia maclaganii]
MSPASSPGYRACRLALHLACIHCAPMLTLMLCLLVFISSVVTFGRPHRPQGHMRKDESWTCRAAAYSRQLADCLFLSALVFSCGRVMPTAASASVRTSTPANLSAYVQTCSIMHHPLLTSDG